MRHDQRTFKHVQDLHLISTSFSLIPCLRNTFSKMGAVMTLGRVATVVTTVGDAAVIDGNCTVEQCTRVAANHPGFNCSLQDGWCVCDTPVPSGTIQPTPLAVVPTTPPTLHFTETCKGMMRKTIDHDNLLMFSIQSTTTGN